MARLFVTSSGTGVGKTLVTAALCWQLRHAGRNAIGLKPVISGYDPQDEESDSAMILRSMGLGQDMAPLISPWRYRAPLAPMMAAQREGGMIAMEELAAFCSGKLPAALAKGEGEYRIVEGVGGVMVPLNERQTTLDWMEALHWPVLVTAGSYLGAISHALTAVDVLRTRALRVRALVVCESEESIGLDDTAAALEKFVTPDIPVVKIPRLPTTKEKWRHAPPLGWICDDEHHA